MGWAHTCGLISAKASSVLSVGAVSVPLPRSLVRCIYDHLDRWEAMLQKARTPDNLQPTFGLGAIYWTSFIFTQINLPRLPFVEAESKCFYILGVHIRSG